MTPYELASYDIGLKEYPPFSNNTKFNTWYYNREVSGSAYPWCMAAVQYWFYHAGFPLPHKTASCGELLRWYCDNQPKRVLYIKTRDKKFPDIQENDIIIFDWKGTNSNTDHTGIAKGKFGSYVHTIEGNTSKDNYSDGGQVLECTRRISDVYAVIRPYDEGDYMTGEEIYIKLSDYLSSKPLPNWAKEEYQEALNMGITDGSCPEVLIPRYQAAIMAKRAVEYYAKNNQH